MLNNCTLILTIFIVSLTLPGCAGNSTGGKGDPAVISGKVISGVPFVKQKDQFCGPAAMASVLAYYGDNITQEEIAEKVYTPKLDGALISDMENYARDSGYKAETASGDITAIEKEIDEGVPVILLVDKGRWMVSVPHYYVVYGYDSRKGIFIVNTGDEGGVKIPFERLDGEWEKMNRLMLIVKK
ncbi:MAG TPA: C39 family peptidase [Thermodesulfobacteriota bacterium]|nr:C39 family peptidase [Thermodesulfobacteriota bacterium]